MTEAQRYFDLFQGFKGAHGQTEVLNHQRHGKQKAKSFIVREPLYIFLSEKVPAVELKDKLAEFASALGFGTCEIFPKQEEVIVERGDVGNFINLPYFQAEFATRFAYDRSGKELTLVEFLDLAEKSKITLKQLRDFELTSRGWP